LVAFLIVTTSLVATASPTRNAFDARDLQRLTASHPGALAPLERGEALASAGDLPGALAAFREAAVVAPESALIARRECQALTRLGQHFEAVQSCLRALRNGGSPVEMRAMVGAFMSGPEPPTTGELAQAMRLARRARDTAPGEPWGYAAECDIAERIRDTQMLEHCLNDLERVASPHDETARAIAMVAPLRSSWLTWAAWSLILLLGLVTVGNLVWRATRSSQSRGGARTQVAMIVLALASAFAAPKLAWAEDAGPGEYDPQTAHPGLLSDWAVDDQNPEKSIPSDQKKERNPLQFGYWLMDLTWKASHATAKGDHQAAIKFYRALATAVPDRSVSFVRLCESYEAAGEWKNAVDSCALALTRPGVTANDYTHFFTLTLAKRGELAKEEVDALSNVVEHLREDPVGRDLADDLSCQLGVRLEDVLRLDQCTTALIAKAPNDPKTILYRWALAVARGNFDDAEALIDQARTTTMKPEGIDQMVRGLASLQKTQQRKVFAWSFGGVAVLFAAGAAMVFATRRRRTPRAA
jgi:tetratricopeptide (TPR) repeat protein